MAMLDTDLDGRISGLFSRLSVRQALFLSGSVAVASVFGMAFPDIIQGVHEGFTSALSHVPAMSTSKAIHAYFEGGKFWLGSAGVGLSDWITGAGGELSHRAANTVAQMQDHLGDRISGAKAFFHHTISNSAEFLGAWRDSVRNSLLANPQTVIDTATDLLTRIVEIWGLYKGISEVYEWASSKMRGTSPKSDITPPRSPNISIGHVENIHVNLAISGKGDVDEVVAKFAQTLHEGSTAGGNLEDPQKSCGRRLQPPAQHKTDITLDHEQIVWLSETFNASLERGVTRLLAKHSAYPLPSSEVARAVNRFSPIKGIEGGFLYAAKAKKDLDNSEAGFAKSERMSEHVQRYEM